VTINPSEPALLTLTRFEIGFRAIRRIDFDAYLLCCAIAGSMYLGPLGFAGVYLSRIPTGSRSSSRFFFTKAIASA
jgi:hypothetical protein